MEMILPNCALLLLILCFALAASSSASYNNLFKGSSLSVENWGDRLISSNGLFSAGFHPVGVNAYCFGIWISKPFCYQNCTIVWMANRDYPVNGKHSKISLSRDGNLLLTDAHQFASWATNTASACSVRLILQDNGNLVLRTEKGEILWDSFDSPTDTLLAGQPLTRRTALVSSRGRGNYSSGFYRLFFDDENVLRLVFDGSETSSIYWPDPWMLSINSGRYRFNDSRIAVFDASGYFRSSDKVEFRASDYGPGMIRRLTLDSDGNLRLYSRDESSETWVVTWQAMFRSCMIHGACGPNSWCNYDPNAGRICSCLKGFRIKNPKDLSRGCEPEFSLPTNRSEVTYIKVPQVNFYGYSINVTRNCSRERCERICLEFENCLGFWYSFDSNVGVYSCYPKSMLRNGFFSPVIAGDMYIQMPKNYASGFETSIAKGKLILNCSEQHHVVLLNRTYKERNGSGTIRVLLWVASILGGVEIIFIFSIWCLLYKNNQSPDTYMQVTSGCRRFTYNELKKATKNFRDEIGRGGGSVVYKGILADNRVAAIKKLHESDKGEDEFLAEISIIWRLNHRNLIEMWGYCAEGKHRLLVCEYMEHGSLAENLYSNAIDWKNRYDIALGTAKGLAYLHEECLEWVLHCDVKPQNILLDSNYQPKVADFGLSKIANRGDETSSKHSKIRGTRGYMAPEWIFNLPITSKVDVYSYGVVVLEMMTRKKSMAIGVQTLSTSGNLEEMRLIKWVREKVNEDEQNSSWIGDILDPSMHGKYDRAMIDQLLKVGLLCVEEDREARPTMSQVVEMLSLGLYESLE